MGPFAGFFPLPLCPFNTTAPPCSGLAHPLLACRAPGQAGGEMGTLSGVQSLNYWLPPFPPLGGPPVPRVGLQGPPATRLCGKAPLSTAVRGVTSHRACEDRRRPPYR